MSSAENICKQFGSKSEMKECQAWSGSIWYSRMRLCPINNFSVMNQAVWHTQSTIFQRWSKLFFQKCWFKKKKKADDKKSMLNFKAGKYLNCVSLGFLVDDYIYQHHDWYLAIYCPEIIVCCMYSIALQTRFYHGSKHNEPISLGPFCLQYIISYLRTSVTLKAPADNLDIKMMIFLKEFT